MSGKRKIPPQKKLMILMEGLRGDVSIAEVCRRHGITSTQFYDWKKRLLDKANEVFATKRKSRAKEERQSQEIEKLKSVIAEITAENLDLKKTYMG